MGNRSIVEALKDAWADRLAPKTVEYDGKVSIDLRDRTAVFEPQQGRGHERHGPDPVVIDDVDQVAISTALRSVGGHVDSHLLEIPVLWADIQPIDPDPNLELYDDLEYYESKLDYLWGPMGREHTICQLQELGLPLERPEVDEKLRLKQVGVSDRHHANLPAFGDIMEDMTLDAELSWKAMETAYRAIRKAGDDPIPGKTLAGNLESLKSEIEATLVDAETSLPAQQLAGDAAYQIALRTQAVLATTHVDFQWGFAMRCVMLAERVCRLQLTRWERRDFEFRREGNESELRQVRAEIADLENWMERIIKEKRKVGMATALASA